MSHTIEAAAAQPVRPAPRFGWIRRHPLLAFFGWFFTVGQAFAFTPLLIDTPVPAQVFIIGSTLFGLLLPALVITRLAEGPEALRRMLRSFVDWRVGLRWYAFVLLAVPLVTLGLGVLFAGAPDDWTGAIVSVFLLQLVLALVPNNWAEEGVWTGFVQTRLQARHGAVLGAVLTAPLFAVQHISLVADGGLVTGAILLAALAIVAIPYRIVTGFAWNRTGSLFLLGLVHAAGNAAAAGSGFGGGVLRHMYPDNVLVGTLHLLAFALIGLTLLAVTKGRIGPIRSI
jgi:membrane protease YdiL (CAAX protease family)